MPKYVIERELPGAGNMGTDELVGIARRSNEVLQRMGPAIQWVHSYVTDDKIYCVYVAPNEDMVIEHARCGRFPADSVAPIRAIIDPTTAEQDVRAPAAG